MDVAQLPQLISTVGFPIVMCGYFALRFEKTLQKHTDTLVQFMQEMKKGVN